MTQSALLVLLMLTAATVQGQQPAPNAEHGTHPVVSPDGHHIAFTSNRDGRPDVYVMNDDGSHVVRLTDSEDAELVSGWSADGKRIYFSVFKSDSATIYAVPTEGGAAVPVGSSRGQGTKITRDGRRVVYGKMPWQTMQLFTAAVDGSSARQLSPGTSAFYCHAISADGNRVATSRSDAGALQIWVFELSRNVSRQVTNFTGSSRSPQCPDWSPDGKQLAVQGYVVDEGDSKTLTSYIWLIDVTTGTPTRLGVHPTKYNDELPSWFPDGRHIAFQSDRTGRWEIWVMNSDGSNAHQLT